MADLRISGLLLTLQLALAAAVCNTGFSVVAPEVAVPGKTTVVLVTLHGNTGADAEPQNVTVRLETQDDNEVKLLTSASQMITGYGIIPLKIPSSPATHCMLHTAVGCSNEDCTSRSHSVMRLLGPVRDVIIRPSRHRYRPGETITFWVLALDHDLRLVRDELAHVALIDPAGTKVAIWEQLSMDEGVRKLTSILANGARSGTWRIEAGCGGGSSSVDLVVSSGPATSAPAAPVAEQHYVELRFADNMRRRYKPGLPFVGRVEAMSTEKQVRVRVKLYDDQTDIYSQDIDMSTGEGGFVVPTVMADAPYINLQAELVAVEGKEIESHYVLAKERIKRWNSTSKCYLLVENIPTPLQAGSIASASIWSSCGCEAQLLAAVTTGGRAIHWAAVPAPNTTDSTLCRFNYTFPVSGEMAPVSSLLVYYVTETGEPVSDVASFHVRLLHKEVAIAVEERRWWYPRATLQLRVLAPPDSTVCLIGARQPPDTRFDPHQSSTEDHQDQPGPEFVSAGVSLFVGGGGECGGVLYRQSSSPQKPETPHLVPPTTHDRLYMWKCFNYSTQLSTDGVTITAPSEAGRWSLWALSLSSRGLRFSSPKTINVFRPIQLDFTLPPALKVGETVEVDVKITNNINNCMDVTALLALSAGASFASTGALYVTERLRLGPRGGTQLVVRVVVNTPGRKNITVEITGYSADNCSVSYTSFNNETLVGSVIRSACVLVLPEGLHKSDTQSAYFCANEHLAVSSRSSWEWQWVQAPRNRAGLVLELKSQGAAHVALSAIEAPSDDMYRVVFERSKVWIARGKHGYDVHLASAEQTESDDECGTSVSWCSWWVWWEGGRLSVGRGAVPSERRLLVWPLAPDMRIKFVGFSALWGDKADFRIWNFNEEAGFSQVLELGLPHGVVPGSASGTLLISGGLHLPLYSMQSLTIDQWAEAWRDSKLSAAIASVAPLLALEQIPHLIEESEREKILKKLPEQVQVLLSFRKNDFSFSDHPSMPSHLSTIQMLEILSKIQSYYPIDPELLQSIKKFIQKRQDSDGSFKPLPADKEVDYFPQEMNSNEEAVNEYVYYDKYGNMTDEKIEFEKTVEVTAETLTALLEVGVESQTDANVAKQAQTYLEKNLSSLTSPAALAATVLALVLARSPVVPEALEILKNASTTEEGEFGWPSPRKNAADWLLEDNSKTIKTTSYEAVTMEQYVAAVRVLLAACARGALSEGEDAARFLYYRASTLQKHPSLAYSATKAAAQFAALAHDRHRSLTVSLATAGMELTDTLELRAKTPPKQLQLPGLPTKVFVYATGAGCATVQGTISFSTYTPISENSLLYIQSGIIEEIRPERSSIEDLEGNLPTLNLKTCFRWKGKQRSGILRLEVSLFSGYELHTVNPVVLDEATFADLHHGSRNEAVWFVFANISSACPVCVTYQVRSHFMITGLRPAFAKVYPLSRPDLAAETFFHARPGSLLLRGTNEDDFSTWFDRNDLSNKKLNDVESICECGRICRRININDNITETTKPNKNNKKAMHIQTTHSNKEQKVNKTKSSTNKKVSESHGIAQKINNITTKIYQATTEKVESIPETVTKSAFTSTEQVVVKSTAGYKTTKQTSTVNDNIGAIIIPTAIYTNTTTRNQTTENQLIPPIGGELIVQKVQHEKPPKPKIANTPLLRRKGTLKSTYGENHERFFIRVMNETTMANGTIDKPFKKALILKSKATVIPKGLYNIETLSHDEKIIIENQAVTDRNEIVPFIVKTKPVNVSIIKEQKPTTIKSTLKPLLETVTPRNLVVVTNNYIKIMLNRTQKPKEPTQIKKPNHITNVTSSEDITRGNTKTKLREILEKSHTKLLKSINKEIHKIPSKPISETSKLLTTEAKPEIAVQNKKGFQIIDNNSLWELLKENHQITKPDEKLQIQYLNLNNTELSSNRSL